MCSVPGYDASGLVRDLAAEENKQITSISIGKNEVDLFDKIFFCAKLQVFFSCFKHLKCFRTFIGNRFS